MSLSIQYDKFLCKSVVFGLIAIVGFAGTGCSNFGGDKGVTVTRVEGAGTDPVDAQERQRRFKSAYEYGIKFARQKRYAEALAGFEEAVRLQPNSVPAQFNLAACYEGIGDPLKAIGIYNRILRVQPNDADCYHNLGTSYMKMHHLDRSPQWKKLAVQAWQRSLDLRPDQPQVREFLARANTKPVRQSGF